MAAISGNPPSCFRLRWGRSCWCSIPSVAICCRRRKPKRPLLRFRCSADPIYAAFTGVLLWLSSLTAGWADNWFALHRLHDALAYQRRLKWVFGAVRAQAIADFAKKHVAGVAANVSLT